MRHRSRTLVGLGVALVALLALVGLVSSCTMVPTKATTGLQSPATVIVPLSSSTTTEPPRSTTATAPALSSTTASVSTKTATVGPVSLDYPVSWFAQANGDTGFTIAEHKEDLTATRPSGAFMRVEIAGGGSADTGSVLQEMTGTSADAAATASSTAGAVAVQPEQFQLAGRRAVVLGVQEGSGDQATLSYYVVAETKDGTSVVLTMEAPAAQWASKRPALEAILSAVRFQ